MRRRIQQCQFRRYRWHRRYGWLGRLTPTPTVTNFTVSPTVAGTGANGVGQFVNFNWATTNATSISVTPTINGDDQALPLQGPFQDTGAPTTTTTFTAIATDGTTNSTPATVTLTVVPVTLSASTTTIQAGNGVTLTYGGPNNNSSWSLLIGGNPNPTPLPAPTCSGNTCTGTYTTGPLNSNTTFTVSATGPVGGQATINPRQHYSRRRHHHYVDGQPAKHCAGRQFATDVGLAECVFGYHRARPRQRASVGIGFGVAAADHDLHRNRHLDLSGHAPGNGFGDGHREHRWRRQPESHHLHGAGESRLR